MPARCVIVAYVSRFMTLEQGDIITKRTPAGVGMDMQPKPVCLCEGDIAEISGGPLGAQPQRIAASI